MSKSLLTLVFIIIVAARSSAQEFQENFLGEDFLQYKGVFFKLKDDVVIGKNYTFYGDLKYCQEMLNNNVIYPDPKYSFVTMPDSLKNKVYKVVDIVGKDGEPFKGGNWDEKPIIVLNDTMNDQTIYYLYDKTYDFEFPFLTSEIKLDLEALCLNIKREVDDFTDEIQLYSPRLYGTSSNAPVVIYKIINATKTSYYLSLNAYGNTINVGERGVIILFEDGTKINKPSEKIDVTSGRVSYEYSAFMRLSELELKILTTKKIKKFRLHIYDREVKNGFATKFMRYVECTKGKN